MLKHTALVLALVAAVPLEAAAPISQEDRDALIKDLERSRLIFLEEIDDVNTEAQWNFKPAPDRWSVAECAAHIIAAEDYYRQNVAAMLKTPAIKATPQAAERDAVVKKISRDRSKPVQAPAALEPAGKVVPKEQAIRDFEAARAKTLEYVRTTQDPLREHATGTAPNLTSAYQQLLMLSGHTERHTVQLLLVKVSEAYPPN